MEPVFFPIALLLALCVVGMTVSCLAGVEPKPVEPAPKIEPIRDFGAFRDRFLDAFRQDNATKDLSFRFLGMSASVDGAEAIATVAMSGAITHSGLGTTTAFGFSVRLCPDRGIHGWTLKPCLTHYSEPLRIARACEQVLELYRLPTNGCELPANRHTSVSQCMRSHEEAIDRYDQRGILNEPRARWYCMLQHAHQAREALEAGDCETFELNVRLAGPYEGVEPCWANYA